MCRKPTYVLQAFTCIHCGTEAMRRKRGNDKQLYCSRRCALKALRIRKGQQPLVMCSLCKAKPSPWGTVNRCRECDKHYRRLLVQARRRDVLRAYSGNPPRCVCCGEDEERFLTIDHVNNDGSQQRKEVHQGALLYNWLKKNGWPEGFQILCYNCNLGRAHNRGKCPHRETLFQKMERDMIRLPYGGRRTLSRP